MMRLCLFGGSFDPVHDGHLSIARKSVETCQLDQVIFLPCAQSPLKDFTPGATDEQRLDMLRLATRDLPWAVVDRTDLDWPPPSWSWRLAEYFQQKFPNAELFWLMGTDQWRDLEKWGRWRYLASLVTFIVHHREAAPLPRHDVKALFLEGHHPAAASSLREDLRDHSDWLHPDVLAYIRNNGLYSE